MAICAHTGIAIPECSCSACLEEQLRRYQPDLLEIEIRLIRTANGNGERPRHRQGKAI